MRYFTPWMKAREVVSSSILLNYSLRCRSPFFGTDPIRLCGISELAAFLLNSHFALYSNLQFSAQPCWLCGLKIKGRLLLGEHSGGHHRPVQVAVRGCDHEHQRYGNKLWDLLGVIVSLSVFISVLPGGGLNLDQDIVSCSTKCQKPRFRAKLLVVMIIFIDFDWPLSI